MDNNKIIYNNKTEIKAFLKAMEIDVWEFAVCQPITIKYNNREIILADVATVVNGLSGALNEVINDEDYE